MTATGDRRLQQALRDLTSALDATHAPWMVIGGIAVIARGVRRFTADIDAAVRGDGIQIDRLIVALAKKHIVARIPDADQFARENLVLLMRHEPSGVDFDISFAWTEFEHEAIAAATVAAFGSVKAPMARAEDLIIFKSIAGRGKDMDDVSSLLALYPQLDLARVRARVGELTAVAEAPELAAGLEKVIAASAEGRDATRDSRTKDSVRERVARAKRGPKTRPKSRSKISAKSGRSSPEKPKRSR